MVQKLEQVEGCFQCTSCCPFLETKFSSHYSRKQTCMASQPESSRYIPCTLHVQLRLKYHQHCKLGSRHLDKGKNKAGYDVSKWLMFQGSTEINVESSWVCDCVRSMFRAEHVHGSCCLPEMQRAQVTIPWCQTRCANRDIPALSEVVLLLSLAPLKMQS